MDSLRQNGWSVIFLMILTLLSGANSTRASVGGGISGTVTDGSGASVPRATIAATHTATGVRHLVSTNSAGSYSFPSLPVGQYDVDITAVGFRPYRRVGIAVDVGGALLVDAVLELGEI